MLMLRWAAMLLYPAGHFARRISVEASVRLPDGWGWACGLAAARADGAHITFSPSPLDVLVDSPLLAGRHFRRVELDKAVSLALAADHPHALKASDDQLSPHRALVREMDALMGARPFERYVFLTALSDELGGGGVEHQTSSEIVLPTDYFSAWEPKAPRRDVFAHEFTHAWNGKFRQGADSWTPSFERPIRNSLMWVYEGQTQYWGQVLAVRAGLWTPGQALDALARTAAIYANRPGGRWRPMSDTTRDPIIAARQPLPWPSWQRSEDYYSEGELLWLDVDTLIRELSDDTRSLDDFAHRFFGQARPGGPSLTYRLEDVVTTLHEVADHDWRHFLTERLESREVGAPLDGLERGGYRLSYGRTPTAFAAAMDAEAGLISLRFSIGIVATSEGVLKEVIWDSPAFDAGLTAGAKLLGVNGRSFDPETLKQAVTDAERTGLITCHVARGQRVEETVIAYSGGHRYPRLQPIAGARRRLDEILAPRRTAAP